MVMPIVDYLAQAGRWRRRAEELRKAAGEICEPERQSWLDAANEWDSMAAQAERLFKVAQTVGHRAA
jgi:hypothetical protein